MQAVLTRKRFGCSASATSVEGSTFADPDRILVTNEVHRANAKIQSFAAVSIGGGLSPQQPTDGQRRAFSIKFRGTRRQIFKAFGLGLLQIWPTDLTKES